MARRVYWSVTMPRLASLLLASSLAAVAACGTTTQFAPTNPSPRPMAPRHPDTVQVFTTGNPEVPYVEVGIIQSRQSSRLSLHEMPEMIRELRKEAAKIGCDGVILNGANNTTEGHVIDGDGSAGTLEGFWGACIMWVHAGGPGATATAP